MANRGTRNVLGLPAAHALNVLNHHYARVGVSTQREFSILRCSVARAIARDAVSAQVSVLRQSRQWN